MRYSDHCHDDWTAAGSQLVECAVVDDKPIVKQCGPPILAAASQPASQPPILAASQPESQKNGFYCLLASLIASGMYLH